MIGATVLEFKTVDSTNSYAKQLVSNTKPSEGTAIIAQYQTEGRGQMALESLDTDGKAAYQPSKWTSTMGDNLLCSIILYPRFLPLGNSFRLNQMVSLSIVDALEAHLNSAQLKVKWPNDVYYGHLKLAGILIENTIEGQHLGSSVVGVGLNVNQLEFEEHLPNPGSLGALMGKSFDVRQLFDELCEAMTYRYKQMEKHPQQLDADYVERLYMKGRLCRFADEQDEFQGMIMGVKENGHLTIASSGRVQDFDFKAVRLLR